MLADIIDNSMISSQVKRKKDALKMCKFVSSSIFRRSCCWLLKVTFYEVLVLLSWETNVGQQMYFIIVFIDTIITNAC